MNLNQRSHAMKSPLAVLALCLALTGCGTTSLQRHAAAARAVDSVAIVAHDVVFHVRAATIAEAAIFARHTGGDEAAVRAAAQAAADRFDASPVRRALDAFEAADLAYAQAVLAWTADQPHDVAGALRAVLASYEALREAVETVGLPGTDRRLPAVPDVVRALIGGAK